MRIALAHDYLNQYGGAERVLQVLGHFFPQAPIYTSLYDAQATGGVFQDRVIRTSFLQKVPLANRYHHAFSLLMPLAIEQLDTAGFDTVLSLSTSFAKGLITRPNVKHICYCLTPPRFLWDDSQKFVQQFRYPGLLKALATPALSYLRIWDKQAADRVDQFIAISQFVRRRIQKYYDRESQVIYPPVNVAKFAIAPAIGDYFFMVGRLVSYKRFDLAVQVFNELGWPLKIAGTGVEFNRLRQMAKPNIQFLGQVNDQQLADLHAHAQALIFPQEEDFGIVPLEAMASGRPVIAYRGGGAVETVVEGQTGIFFDEQTPASLAEAVRSFAVMNFSPALCRAQAEKFDIPVFQKNILEALR